MQGLFEEFDRELLLGQEILSRRSREERTVVGWCNNTGS